MSEPEQPATPSGGAGAGLDDKKPQFREWLRDVALWDTWGESDVRVPGLLSHEVRIQTPGNNCAAWVEWLHPEGCGHEAPTKAPTDA